MGTMADLEALAALLEPVAVAALGQRSEVTLTASLAISAKRQADALEKIAEQLGDAYALNNLAENAGQAFALGMRGR